MVDVKDGKLSSTRQTPRAHSTRDVEARIARVYLRNGKWLYLVRGSYRIEVKSE